MKKLLFVLVLVTACGDKKEEGKGTGGGGYKPDPAGCDPVANKLAATRAKSLALGSKLPHFAAAVYDICKANAWPQPVRECLVSASTDATSKACVDNAETKDKLVADLNAAIGKAGGTAPW